MKILLQLADRLQELSDKLKQSGNKKSELGIDRICGAWDPDHNPIPSATR